MSNAELLPCPFCGRDPKTSNRADDHSPTKHIWYIVCFCDGYSARAHQYGHTEAEVVEKWNRRAERTPPATAQAGELAEVVRCLIHISEDGSRDVDPLDENSPLMDAARTAIANYEKCYGAPQLKELQDALLDACELLEGWIAKYCHPRYIAEHQKHVAKLRAIAAPQPPAKSE